MIKELLLLPLPEPCPHVLPTGWIRYTPDQMREYALANLQAAKPADPTIKDSLTVADACPRCGDTIIGEGHPCVTTEIQYDPDDVAFPKGFMPVDNATQGATIQTAESIAAQGTIENSATENATLPATDALGSLPVVADAVALLTKLEQFLIYHGDKACIDVSEWKTLWLAVADHAQATAEIAKRDAEIAWRKQLIEKMEHAAKHDAAKLAGVDGLVEALRDIAGDSDDPGAKLCASHAIHTYEAAQETK